MKKWIACILAMSFAAAALAQDPEGAKELFGGGVNRKVVGLPRTTPDVPKKPAVKGQKQPEPAFGLSCWIELVEGPGKPGTQVTYTRSFKSGEKIRLHFQGNAGGYISLIQLGASGTSSVLFPDPSRGLIDNAIRAGVDRVLPSERDWFRFDATPGTERVLVLFAKTPQELESFIRSQAMDMQATAAMVQVADRMVGSKDLVTETVEDEATYVVNKVGNLVVMHLALVHQ